MSLINDALKKAQKQRTGDAPELNKLPSIGGESAVRIARRDKPPAFNALLLWIGVGAAALVVLLLGGFFLVRTLMSHSETLPAAKPAALAQTTPAVTPPAPTAIVPTVSTAGNSAASSATPKPAPAPVVETKPVVVVPAAPPPEPEVPKPVVPAPKMDSKAVAFIETLRVAGIRPSSTDSKVLMNDRVYRTGDTVEHQLGLKLAVIAPYALTFEDENGARYTRNF